MFHSVFIDTTLQTNERFYLVVSSRASSTKYLPRVLSVTTSANRIALIRREEPIVEYMRKCTNQGSAESLKTA